MERSAAFSLLRAKMNEHGLNDWAAQFDSARRRFGYCSWSRKIISLSEPLSLINNESEVLDTILHEIAHALTPHQGHNAIWKLKCQEIGARPQRCYSTANAATPSKTFVGTCQSCGKKWFRFRRLRNGHHIQCKDKVGGGKLMWRRNREDGISKTTKEVSNG